MKETWKARPLGTQWSFVEDQTLAMQMSVSVIPASKPSSRPNKFFKAIQAVSCIHTNSKYKHRSPNGGCNSRNPTHTQKIEVANHEGFRMEVEDRGGSMNIVCIMNMDHCSLLWRLRWYCEIIGVRLAPPKLTNRICQQDWTEDTSEGIPEMVSTLRETVPGGERFSTTKIGYIPDGKSGSIDSSNTEKIVDIWSMWGRRSANTYISVVSLRQAADVARLLERPTELLDSAYGSVSSTRLECLQLFGSASWGSERQSVINREPRQSETRNSLLVDGWELIVVRGWGNPIT